MKVLLQYFNSASQADKVIKQKSPSSTLELESLQQTIQDNLRRVIGYLISRQILVKPDSEGSEQNSARVDLYTKSREVIGAFWTD